MEDLARLRCASVRFRICGGIRYMAPGVHKGAAEKLLTLCRDMVSSWKHEKDILHLYVGPKILHLSFNLAA